MTNGKHRWKENIYLNSQNVGAAIIIVNHSAISGKSVIVNSYLRFAINTATHKNVTHTIVAILNTLPNNEAE